MKDFSQFYVGLQALKVGARREQNKNLVYCYAEPQPNLQALKGRYISAQVVRPGYEDVHHNSGLKGRHIMGIIQRSIVLVSNYKLPCIVPTLQAGIWEAILNPGLMTWADMWRPCRAFVATQSK